MDYKTWNPDNPGGTIVLQYTQNGVTYVEVEFKNSSGQRYTYILEKN